MYCEKCGTKLQDDAEFCSNCGTSTAIIDDGNYFKENLKLSVTPTYKFLYSILPYIPMYAIFSSLIFMMLYLINFKASIIALIIGIACFLIVLFVKSSFDKRQYVNLCYDFYETRVICKDNFFNTFEKEVEYRYIKEVYMHQTFTQSLFNLGNIVLYTNAANGYDNGINIINVENVEDVYKKIKLIIEIK